MKTFEEKLDEALMPKEMLSDKLEKYGVDASDPTIKKIIKFGQYHPDGTQVSMSEVEELKKGERLVAWLGDPVPEFDSLKQHHWGYYVFDPENRDVAELLDKTKSLSIIWHILNGLAFGYPPDDILDFVEEREKETEAYKKLRRAGLKTKADVVLHDDTIYVAIGGANKTFEQKVEKLKEKMEPGTEFVEPTSPPFAPIQIAYYVGIRL